MRMDTPSLGRPTISGFPEKMLAQCKLGNKRIILRVSFKPLLVLQHRVDDWTERRE